MTQRKPKCLDLCCGQGGAAMGLMRAGYDVYGVDIVNQPHYPSWFLKADAMEVPLEGFDLVWASPSCQAHSRTRAMRRSWPYEDLLTPLRARLEASGVRYVIENVPGAPGAWDLLLCGTMFGLRSDAGPIHRHRYFASSERLALAPFDCNHEEKAMNVYTSGSNRVGTERQFMDAMGVTWGSTVGGLECIPPAYSEWIGRQLVPQTVAA